MKKNYSKIITIAFLGGVFIWMLAAKDREFSQRENRYLAKFPSASKETVLNGEFMSGFETYMADQFPARDACVGIKTAVLRVMGQRLINDIYIGKDNYLIQKTSDFDEDRVDGIVEVVNSFADGLSDISVNMMLVPTAESIYEDKLPYTAVSHEKEYIESIGNKISPSINIIDVFDAIESDKKIGMYYKTDHHWTARGAFAAFEEYAKAMGINPEKYVFYPVTDNFQGTCASGSGVNNVNDVIEICVPENSEGTYYVNFIQEKKKTASLFDSSKLNEKDKYQVFMGGNYSQVDIRTSAATGKNLMIIKDSYGNCFVPMLTPYYDRIIVIDPRYFNGDIYDLIKKNDINEVLFLYNINSFITDNSLGVVLEK
ncbi:MAG: DHHW family protein [Butyrivibrio sp.]